jgi:GR25 family glycosyltransferase involved in LPS biosynthesis
MDILYFFLVIMIILILVAVTLLIIRTLLSPSTKHEMVDINLKVCVINLARRRDRMLEFSKHYSLPIKYQVIDAVDGKNIEVHKLHEKGILGAAGLHSLMNMKQGIPRKYHYELGTPGAIGCSLSHIRIWKNIVESTDIENMLVFEDDALVMGITLRTIASRLADLPANWHIYMIGQPHTVLEGIPVSNKKDMYRITRFCGTHAYIINRNAAEWLLANGKLFPINQQIDSHLSELASDHGLAVYLHMGQTLYGSFGGQSDIQMGQNTQNGRMPLQK